jgi:DNA polymerase elongation subunit (family B)
MDDSKIILELIDDRLQKFSGHVDLQTGIVGKGIESIKEDIHNLEEKLDAMVGRVIGVEKDVERCSCEIAKIVEGERIKFDHVWDELRNVRKERLEIYEKEKKEFTDYIKTVIKNEILTLKVWMLIQGFVVVGVLIGWIISLISKKIPGG